MLLEFDDAQRMTVRHRLDQGERSRSAPLLACVRATFPSLVIRNSRLDRSGGDHQILVLNDDHAFRFPRDGVHDLRFEIEVLRKLCQRTALAVPRYDLVDPAGRFAGYRFIDGEALTTERFAQLDQPSKAHALDAAATFLVALHDLPQAELNWPGDWPKAWTAAQFVDRCQNERLPLIVRHAPHLAGPIEAFFAVYRQDRPEHLALIHGDLVGEHMLVDGAGSALTGIIDFGDVALGDPAQDLLGFWSYGRQAVARVITRYDRRGDDPGLLRRSFNHFVRYRIDHLFECLAAEPVSGRSAPIAAAEALLATSPLYNQ